MRRNLNREAGAPEGADGMLLRVSILGRGIRATSAAVHGVVGVVAPAASSIVGSITGPLNAAAGGDPDSPRAAGRRQRRSARRARRS